MPLQTNAKPPTYSMRRARQQTSDAEAREILTLATWGTLAFADAHGQTYAVPMNHVLVGNTLYFHGSARGCRGDALAAGPIPATFVAVAQDTQVAAEITTAYRSVICEGTLRLVHDVAEKNKILMALTQALTPEPEALIAAEKCIARGTETLGVYALEIERMSGKVGSIISAERARARRIAQADSAAHVDVSAQVHETTHTDTTTQVDTADLEGNTNHE